MAERRMLSNLITDSDAFLEMPLSTQALYMHLNLKADDDGFVNNPKKIQRDIGASEDDLKLLIAKAFILKFENGVIVIKHWRINNYIRSDRYKPTLYQEEKSLLDTKENGIYTMSKKIPELPTENVGIPDCYQKVTQYSIEEINIDKTNISNAQKKTFTKPTIEEIQDYINEKSYEYVDAEEFYYFYDAKGWLVGKDKMKDWKSSVAGWNARNKNKKKENTGNYQPKEQVVYKYTNQFQTEKKASSPKDYGLKYEIDEVKVLAQKKKDNGDPRPLDEIEESIFWGHEDGE